MSGPRSLAGRGLRWRSGFLPVSALLGLFTFGLYRRALGTGILSDGWELLRIASLGVRKAPFVLLSYHTIPVTNLFNAVLWKLFGLHETAYQILNLGELALVACALYGVGCALLRQPRVALLGALLFLANSSFYEVPFWPVVGNFQSLAALLYLAGILAVHRAGHSRRPFLWASVFALCGLAAFFTYEPAVSVFAVGLLLALVPAGETQAGIRSAWRRLRPYAVPLLAAAAVVVGSKMLTARAGHAAMFLPETWAAVQTRAYLLVRGCLAILTLRGADGTLYKTLTFGLTPPGGSRLYLACLGLWIAVFAAGGALLAARTRRPAVRLLIAWFAVHMVTVSLATSIVSRHFYLGALPACLLLAWYAWRLADRLVGRLVGWLALLGMPETEASTLLVFLAFSLAVAGAKSDLDLAAALGKEATQGSRQVVHLVRERLARSAATPRVALVNMPAVLTRDGIGVFAFVNGLRPMLGLSTAGRVRPALLYTYTLFRDGKLANASKPVTLSELAERVRDPDSLVLMFDPRTRTVIPLERTTWQLPAAYTAGSAPYLDWQENVQENAQEGDPPWFRVYAGQPLELPLAGDGDERWAALKYRRAPGVRFTVTGAGSPLSPPLIPLLSPPLIVHPGDTAKVGWPAALFPLAGGETPARVTLRPESDVSIAGLWSFRPPSSYLPETAPFLTWDLTEVPRFGVDEPLRLPLAAPGGAEPASAVRLEILAEGGRELAVGIEGGPLTELDFRDVRRPEWRALELAAPARTADRSTLLLRIEPRGRLAAAVRRLSVGKSTD